MTTLIDNQTETITIRLVKGRYYKTFNAYGKTYRISKDEATESIAQAKSNGCMYCEQKDWWSYFN